MVKDQWFTTAEREAFEEAEEQAPLPGADTQFRNRHIWEKAVEWAGGPQVTQLQNELREARGRIYELEAELRDERSAHEEMIEQAFEGAMDDL